jgi:predicted amidophosphoribosyltransferase
MALQQTFLSYNNALYDHYYLCRYLPRSAGRDTLSHSLLKFKQGRHPDLEGWIDCATEMLTAMPLPPHTTLIRALHHNETTIPDTPIALDLLGQALASRFHHHYCPRLLQKARLTAPVKAFAKPQREEELQDLYSIAPSDTAAPGGIPRHWLIIDDILTSGATARAILQAILDRYPTAPVTIFTLTRADIATPPHSSTSLKGRHYQLEEGQDWTVSEPSLTYYSLPQLKNMIRSDIF